MANFTRLSLIRVIELALICIIIGLHAHSAIGTLEDSFLSSGTEVGFLIILTGLFTAAMMGMPVNRRVEVGFLVVGCALFIASGALVMDIWRRNRTNHSVIRILAARGSISIIEGAILIVDAILVFKGSD